MQAQTILGNQLTNDPNWASQVQAIAAIIGVLISALGFYLLIYQIKQLKKVLHSNTQSNLFDKDTTLLKEFIQSHALRPYFYDNKDIDETNADYHKVCALAEAWANHFEHIVLQTENLPDHVRDYWTKYIKDNYSTNPTLRKHLCSKKSWYSERLFKIIDN